MPSLPKNTKATVIPCLRYRDAQAAIEWLCRAFGFEKHLVVPGEGGTIAHAELSFGNGIGAPVIASFSRMPEVVGIPAASLRSFVAPADDGSLCLKGPALGLHGPKLT